MNSITQKKKFVNDFSSWQDKKTANIKLSKKMYAAGFKRRAFLMEHCGDYIMFGKCEDCGNIEVQHANLCRDRLCPICSWRLSRKLFAEMCQTLCYIRDLEFYSAGFLTLTVKNCRVDDLGQTLKEMSEAWHRMWASNRQLKKMVAGTARSVEITYNSTTKTFHPHYHVIVLFNDSVRVPVMQKSFNRAWGTACGKDYTPITDFRVIENIDGDNTDLSGAIAETYKYAVKHDICENLPLSVFREFVKQIAGKRFQAYSGIIKKARQELSLSDTEDIEEGGAQVCMNCGGTLQRYIAEWSFTHNQYVFMLDYLANGTTA
mgnify:CR=1 FL=1